MGLSWSERDRVVSCCRCGVPVYPKGRKGLLACWSCRQVDPTTCVALGATNVRAA